VNRDEGADAPGAAGANTDVTVTAPAGCVDGLLAGRYRPDERIAVGGMGEVWRAEDVVLSRVVAVKCMKPEYVDDDDFRERFRAEARHAAGLSHPGIASVYDYGEQTEPEKAAWLVMELVDGEPLSALLRRTGRLSADQTLDIVGQAALGLEAAHLAGVVHRDVKPGNLLVRPDGVVKITDFGIAWAADAVPLTRTGTVVGTAYYLSPEQATGAPVTPASDVYSLGVVAYECLAGVRPFPGTNPVAVATAHMQQPPPPLPSDIPPPVRDLVLGALAKDPKQRPAHAGDFGRAALALRRSLAQGHVGPAPTEVVPLVPPGARPEPEAGHTRALPEVAAPATISAARPHNHRRAVRAASILLAFVVLALSVRACLGPKDVRVPAVPTGSSVAAAMTLLSHGHLETRQTKQSSTTVPAGHVIGTDPRAGTTLHEGDAVTLLVSSGRPPVTVSSAAFTGRNPTTVSTTLSGLGLRPTLAYDGSGTPAGTVSSVSPTGSLPYGATVTVHVVPAPRVVPAPAPVRPAGPAGGGKKKHGKR
jgi:tRNA A-37 threonylcarbamoyl transferase component Bud32